MGPEGRVVQDSGLCCLHSELKSTIILVLVLGEFSLASTVTVFFIYTAELLPTVLRYESAGPRGGVGEGTVTRLMQPARLSILVCQESTTELNMACLGCLTQLSPKDKTNTNPKCHGWPSFVDKIKGMEGSRSYIANSRVEVQTKDYLSFFSHHCNKIP